MTPVNEQTRKISLHVNGKLYQSDVRVRWTLVDYLRHQLKLTGSHVGCEHGVCGACTVLVDGLSVRACMMLAVQANGRYVVTIEGVAPAADELHPLQMAFKEQHGLQCGFCTPGMVITLLEFLKSNPDPTEREIREAISGNLCRCTGYDGIVKATLVASARMREMSSKL